MADEKEAPKDAAPKKKKGKLGFYTTLVFLMLLAPYIFPTIVLLFLGLIPTWIAFFVDTDREKSYGRRHRRHELCGHQPLHYRFMDQWPVDAGGIPNFASVFQLAGDIGGSCGGSIDRICNSAGDDVADTGSRRSTAKASEEKYGNAENHMGW